MRRRYGVMEMPELPIEGCVNGKDADGAPCWPDEWVKYEPSSPEEWGLPDFTKKSPWLLLGALALGAYVWLK